MAYPGLVQRGERYRFRVTVEGKQQWITVPREHCRTKTTAGKWMEMFRGEVKFIVPSSVRFGRFAADWIEEAQLKERTKVSYRADLRNHLTPLQHVKVQDISADHVRAVLAMMDKRPDGRPYSGRTKRNVMNLVSAIMQTAVARKVASRNPVRDLERREKPKVMARTPKRILTVEEGRRLLAAARDYARLQQWETMVATGLYTGMRRGEILGIQWRHVDFDAEVPIVRLREDAQLELKGERGSLTKAANRDIEIPPALVDMLKAHRRETRFRGPNHYVFCTGTGRPHNPRNVSRALETIVERAGLYDPDRPITWHVFRHNYGSKLISRGWSPSDVQAQMGHSSSNTTLGIYTHEDKTARRKGAIAATIEEAYQQ